MPRRAIANGVRPISSRSLKRTLPPRGGIRPMMASSVVVLPMPFRPRSATACPLAISKDTSQRTVVSP
jgi:hypothetical protein